MHIVIIFLAFYYLYAKYFRFSNNQNETSEDLHNTSTVPPSCFQRTNVGTNILHIILLLKKHTQQNLRIFGFTNKLFLLRLYCYSQ